GSDLVVVVGSSVFPYYPYIPGPLLEPDTELVAITSDPGEAARAPMGEAIVGDAGRARRRRRGAAAGPAGAARGRLQPRGAAAAAGTRRPAGRRRAGPPERLGG